ncbi:NTCP protein, partial [Thalassarche chlororhynchos]|nr:NTCP protein [Thalassarche chlororhynchos]
SPGHTQSTSLTSVAPPPFAFGQQATDKTLNVILTVVLFVIMVSLGCTMEIAKITTHLRKPKGVAIAVMAQYGVMPLTAFVLGKFFPLGATESLAILICGCCPGGNLSNIFSLALRGDMDLRVEGGTQDIHLTTLIIKIFAQSPPPFPDKQHFVGNFLPCSPLLASVLTSFTFATSSTNDPHRHFPNYCWMVVLLLSSATIIVLSVASVGSSITVVFSPSLLGSSALMPFIGFLLGYVLSTVFKLNDRCRWTVCMETGCQNVQLCLTFLKVAFAPEITGPLYFFPLLYLLFQLGEGLLLVLVFRIHDRIKKPNSK